MRIECSAEQLAAEFNRSLADLEFSFTSNRSRARLQLKDGRRIVFPNQAGGKVREGSRRWVRSKHRDGDIHEPAMVAVLVALQHRVREPVVFFDVGALYGYFALVLKSLSPRSTVLAFEVNPESHEALRRNVEANQHLGHPPVACCLLGLSDRTLLQHSAMIRGIALDEDAAGGTVVDLMRLDDFSRMTGLAPDVLKIDVEGYQAKILPGAMETIDKSEPIILLEFDEPEVMERFGCTNEDVVAPLFERGYSMLWTAQHRDRGTGKFQVLRRSDLTQEHEVNSLAVFVRTSP